MPCMVFDTLSTPRRDFACISKRACVMKVWFPRWCAECFGGQRQHGADGRTCACCIGGQLAADGRGRGHASATVTVLRRRCLRCRGKLREVRSGLQAGKLGTAGAGAAAALHMHPLRCLLCLVMFPACISLLQGQLKYVQTAFHHPALSCI